MKLDLIVDALDGLERYVGSMPKASREAARIALNDVASGEGLALLRQETNDQVAFPPGYLNDERLGVTERARDTSLRVVITGRQRATSLARFASGQTPASTRGRGVRVTVKPGSAREIERGFLVNLRRGNADGGNLGLAIRLKPGEILRNKTEVKRIALDTNVYLLYGPSVDQVFRDVALDESPELLRMAEREFFRQFFRLVA
jgi:hypothetical protein